MVRYDPCDGQNPKGLGHFCSFEDLAATLKAGAVFPAGMDLMVFFKQTHKHEFIDDDLAYHDTINLWGTWGGKRSIHRGRRYQYHPQSS
jgi:hypothetical protein